MSYKIMAVDDETANLRLLERLFRRDYQILTAESGAEAMRLLEQHDVALLITDQRMPGMTGVELCRRAATLRPHMVRILLTGYTDVGALVEAINCGQVYKYVTKPWGNDDLRVTVQRALGHYESNRERHELEAANRRLAGRLKEMTQGFVRAIADALEAKDEHVYGHARRVSGYSAAIGRRLGLDAETLEQLSLGAFLHDIGRIGTPDQILMKPGPLTAEERRTVELHAERGARILAGVEALQEVATAVRHHHEHYDGSGYPEGLRGEQIPLASRIIFVADAYDAVTSPRPFRQACGHDEAVRTLEHGAGTFFDPQVVRAFTGLEAVAQIRRSIASGICGGRLASGDFDPEEVSADELRRQFACEPVLAVAVLREANLTFPAEPTADLGVACARLSEARLREVAARHMICDEHEESAPRLREHSARCATAARLLAEHTRIMDSGEAYTLGLLHDVGEVLLRGLYPEEMEGMRGLSSGARIDREVEAFGVDHAQVGEWVLESCGVARSLTAAVQTHHDVMRINAPAALLLHVANAVAHADDAYKVSALDSLGSDRLSMLRLSRADIADIHTRTAAAGEQLMIA